MGCDCALPHGVDSTLVNLPCPGVSSSDYPQRAQLVADLCRILDRAKAPLPSEWDEFGLDDQGIRWVLQLSVKLAQHLWFEAHNHATLRRELMAVAKRYRDAFRSGQRPKLKEYAAQALDGLSSPPEERVAYLGLRHLVLSPGTSVGEVTFGPTDAEPGLSEALGTFGLPAARCYCSVPVVAGTEDLALARARRSAETALALVRQQFLHGFMAKIYLPQLQFGLDGTHAWKEPDGTFQRAGRKFEHQPMEADFSSQRDWLETLAQLSAWRDALIPALRERVDTALDWLDVATLTENWRVMLPAIFSAMEALLIPEESGTKAGAVTVRSVAVHVAVGDGFFDPREVYDAYLWRSNLVHGRPTGRVRDEELLDFAEDRRMWAFRVLSDYLRFAATSAFDSVEALVANLDQTQGDSVCSWLEKFGAGKVVTEYRAMLAPAKPA